MIDWLIEGEDGELFLCGDGVEEEEEEEGQEGGPDVQLLLERRKPGTNNYFL